MAYNYLLPSTPRREPPVCYTKGWDNEHRECRSCEFQTTCRDEVIKAKNRTSNTTDAYYKQFGYSGSPIVPLRSPVAPAPLPQLVPQTYIGRTPMVPFIPNTVSMQPQGYPPGYPPPSNYGDYGWLNDPLHNVMASVPTPMRPQMQGESFIERAAKNTGLAMAEAFFMQAVLAVRQLVLAPKYELPLVQHQEPIQIEQPRKISLPVIQIMPEKPR